MIVSCEIINLNKEFSAPLGKLSVWHGHFDSLKTGDMSNSWKFQN